jgi:predicted MFS family arabinose efflux permease
MDMMATDTTVTPNKRSTSLHITSREWLLLGVLAAIQFSHIVDFMIIMPLGPVFQQEMKLQPEEFGYVVSAYTFSAGIAGLLAARFLDRFDRKVALLVLYAGFIIGTLLCAAAPNYEWLLIARTTAGAFGGIVAALVLAIVGDCFADARRGTAMGVVMSGFSIASIVGVPAGLYLSDVYDNWHIVFIALGCLSVLILVLAWIVLPQLRGHMRGRHVPHISIRRVLAHANHWWAFSLTGCMVMSTFLMAPFSPMFLVRNVGLEKESLKYLYLVGGVGTLATLTLFGRWSDRWGKLRVFRILALATVLPALLLSHLPDGLGLLRSWATVIPASLPDPPGGWALWVVLAVFALFMILSSGRWVPAVALVTNSSAPVYRGSFMSLNAAVQHISAGLAAALGGFILASAGNADISESADGNPAAGAPLVGFAILGWLGAGLMVGTWFVGGRVRPAVTGMLAPDSAVVTSTAGHS